MINKRLMFVGTFFLIALFLILIRLADIQMIRTESFSDKGVNLVQESVNQRTQEVIIDNGRGRFIDRNGNSLRNQAEPTLVLFPFLKDINWPVEEVAKIARVSNVVLKERLGQSKQPLVLSSKDGIFLSESDLKKINELNVPGVFGIYRQISVEEIYGKHVLGITGENAELLRKKYPDRHDLSYKTKIGITGLEKAFDEFLLPDAETKLLYHVDGDGNPLFGINVKYIADSNPFFPVSVKTTLDKEIQQTAEEVLVNHNIEKGGLVLIDIKSNEILAMVSTPQLDRSKENTFINHMLQPLFPGSIFKTVISAAAIEYGLDDPTRHFNCNLNLYGESDGKQKDGYLSFERSFAKSCNYTFTTLAEELLERDKHVIENTANKLGLIGPVGWSGEVFHYENFKQMPDEKRGGIWGDDRDKTIKRAIDQTAIGQKNVKVTPLGVANMMATIARGGDKQQVKIVESILYKNGTNMFSFPSHSLKGEKISPFTATKLQHLLRLVVTDDEGTGRRFQNLSYEVSGKSGTAQTGRMNGEEQPLYNKWFAGFFPSSHPKYALVVVEMDTTSGKAGTNAAFYEIVDKLYKLTENKSVTIMRE